MKRLLIGLLLVVSMDFSSTKTTNNFTAREKFDTYYKDLFNKKTSESDNLINDFEKKANNFLEKILSDPDHRSFDEIACKLLESKKDSLFKKYEFIRTLKESRKNIRRLQLLKNDNELLKKRLRNPKDSFRSLTLDDHRASDDKPKTIDWKLHKHKKRPFESNNFFDPVASEAYDYFSIAGCIGLRHGYNPEDSSKKNTIDRMAAKLLENMERTCKARDVTEITFTEGWWRDTDDCWRNNTYDYIYMGTEFQDRKNPKCLNELLKFYKLIKSMDAAIEQLNSSEQLLKYMKLITIKLKRAEKSFGPYVNDYIDY